MFIFGGMFLGAVLGGLTAKRRGGKALDIAQYAAGFGILFTILGVIVSIALTRLAAA